MSKPNIKGVKELVSQIEQNLSINIYISEFPLKLKSALGSYLGFYCFYESQAFRLEYMGNDLSGVSFWESPGSLLESSIRLDLEGMDTSEIIKLIGDGISTNPTSASSEDHSKEIDEFINYIGSFIKDKGASYAYDSYESWAEVNDRENQLSKQEFYDAFNKRASSDSSESKAFDHIESPIFGETIVVSEPKSQEFETSVASNDDYYSNLLMESAIRCIARDDSSVNAVFICGKTIPDVRNTIKNILDEEDVWASQVLWKDRVTSIYQFISILWKYRSKHILVFDNVDAPLKKKDHNFNNMLDELMKTESPNRIVSYIRKAPDGK
jgi:hypothetical protein